MGGCGVRALWPRIFISLPRSREKPRFFFPVAYHTISVVLSLKGGVAWISDMPPFTPV
jgi:hypothetical protein